MTLTSLSEQDWQIRLDIYHTFAARGRPPTFAEVARQHGISDDQARESFRRLHAAHTLFLQPGSDAIRIANPLSAVETPYQVRVDGRLLYANCAWDSLGIPAMLHRDAAVEVDDPSTSVSTRYAIENGRLTGDSGLVHFPLPFRRWYDDLIHT